MWVRGFFYGAEAAPRRTSIEEKLMAISLALIIILGLLADYLFRRLKLPGLVGMLLVGILVGPHVLGLLRPEMMAVSADFRRIALIVILLRAGFTLRRETLNRTARPALLMSFVPASFEIAGVALAAHYFLTFPWLQALMLGAILGAVSPAVVVPMMIHFMEQGMGAKKGIPTFVLAGSALDNVFAIVIFTQFLSLYQGVQSTLLWDLAGIPIAVVLGIILGVLAGYLLYLFFSRYELASPRRTVLVLGVAIVLTWIGDLTKNLVPIASLLGVLAMGLVILEKAESLGHLISQKLQRLWVVAELILFVLVGAQVDPKVALGAGLVGLAIIGIGLVCRSLGTYLSVSGAGLNFREKLFCVISYIPKATVQAAIGALPLEAGVPGGEIILALAVLSVLVTAPPGVIGISLWGERVLEKEELSGYRFITLRERLKLPRVGQRVRHKRHGTVWKVIEEKEIWLSQPGEGGGPVRQVPALSLRFWKVEDNLPRGTGQTYRHNFLPGDHSFDLHWEIL
jgi:solute carrier family 9B (sodium/hydrogen exchanger), member 1/2